MYPLPSLASEKKCIRDTYRIRHPVSRYVSYSSLGVFVPALVCTLFYYIFDMHDSSAMKVKVIGMQEDVVLFQDEIGSPFCSQSWDVPVGYYVSYSHEHTGRLLCVL